MVKAPAYGAGDSRFESWCDRFNLFLISSDRIYLFLLSLTTINRTHVHVVPSKNDGISEKRIRTIHLLFFANGKLSCRLVKSDEFSSPIGRMAQWLRHLPTEQGIPGSNPGVIGRILFPPRWHVPYFW